MNGFECFMTVCPRDTANGPFGNLNASVSPMVWETIITDIPPSMLPPPQWKSNASVAVELIFWSTHLGTPCRTSSGMDQIVLPAPVSFKNSSQNVIVFMSFFSSVHPSAFLAANSFRFLFTALLVSFPLLKVPRSAGAWVMGAGMTATAGRLDPMKRS